MNIREIREELDTSKSTVKDVFLYSVNRAKKYQDEYNSFVTILDDYEEIKSDSILSGIPYALKDNVSTKGILTTASSKILANYVPVYDATIYEKLKNAGATLVGKTVMDELAMGGTGMTGHTGIVHNPYDKDRMTGGSSAGSAACVKLGIVPFAIGSDTGDSVRKPASYTGTVGFKPTYGRISRYGLFPYASSLDTVGVIANNVYDVAAVMDVIKGRDHRDMTSLPDEDINYVDNLDNDITGKKLFYIKEIVDRSNYGKETNEILDKFDKTIEKCKELGMEVYEESIPMELLELIYPAYMSISNAEATSNDANLTGIHFGNTMPGKTAEEIITNTRTNGFSSSIKRRFIIGSYILNKENQDKLYLNACRLRRMIVDKMNELFKKYDALILPTTETVAPRIDVKIEYKEERNMLLDRHLIIGNFGGYPSITIPCGICCIEKSAMPIGLSITGNIYNDSLVLNIANKIQEGWFE